MTPPPSPKRETVFPTSSRASKIRKIIYWIV
jgi:hypothetical protein